MRQDQVLKFDIEGQEVLCYQTGGHRLWVCQCEYFKRKLAERREGYCPHTALAICRALEGGMISIE